MPLFRGRINELENILIDNFTSYSTHTCFFLSHCHADHMHGLDELLSKLDKNCASYMYCSSISRLILLKKFSCKNESLIQEITQTQVITVPGNDKAPSYQVTVTPISAGHCAGSVMFLFETSKATILYTGDFRILKNDTSKFKYLHNKDQVKLIDKLYLDTTFLNEVYWDFPSRSEAITKLISLIRNWIKNGPDHKVLLVTSALLGYEVVYVELAKNLKCKICVNDFLYNIFWNIPEIGRVLTKDCKNTKVHVSSVFDKKCLNSEDKKVLRIKLSAQWYKSVKGIQHQDIWKETSTGNILICYATHCSCSELLDFLNYLQPKKIEPCTIAVGSTEENTMLYIQQICHTWWKTQKRHPGREVARNVFPPKKNYKFQLAFSQCASTVSEDSAFVI